MLLALGLSGACSQAVTKMQSFQGPMVASATFRFTSMPLLPLLFCQCGCMDFGTYNRKRSYHRPGVLKSKTKVPAAC